MRIFQAVFMTAFSMMTVFNAWDENWSNTATYGTVMFTGAVFFLATILEDK